MKETARTRAWRRAQQLGRFTVGDLTGDDVSRATAEKVISLLVRDGLVEVESRDEGALRGRVATYALTDAGRKTNVPTCIRPGGRDMRERTWRAIRIMRRFTLPDLMRTTGISQSNAQKLVSALIEAKLVRKAGRLQPNGMPGSYQMYRLVQDPGPRLPTLPTKTKAEVSDD